MTKPGSFLAVLITLVICFAGSVPAIPDAGPREALDKARDKTSEVNYLFTKPISIEKLIEGAKEALQLTEAAIRELDSAASDQSGGAYDASRSEAKDAVSSLKQVIQALEYGDANRRYAADDCAKAVGALERALEKLPKA
jgi:hypothetical protein